MIKLPVNVTNITFTVCLLIMLFFTYARNTYRTPTKSALVAQKTQLWLTVISVSNLLMVIVFTNLNYSDNLLTYPWLASLLRPVIVIMNERNARSFSNRYFQVIKGSMPMVIFIVIYMMYFAWMGQHIFIGTIEGVESFADFNDAFFSMFVLLTSANFPGVMLPSYNQ
jgi:hypothetical protein